uniref:hypothetical protein n=1 Tax=Enterocloster clostridioformis TaxID=1531 RepID=UPI00266FF724
EEAGERQLLVSCQAVTPGGRYLWGGCKINQLSAPSNSAYYNYKSSKRTYQGHHFDAVCQALNQA